jgi:hypothetical protein
LVLSIPTNDWFKEIIVDDISLENKDFFATFFSLLTEILIFEKGMFEFIC